MGKQKAPQEGGNHILCPLQGKDKDFRSQYQISYLAFKERPKTMLQVSVETGILRANICRYVDEMRDRGQIQVVRRGLCPLTKDRAGFYSTDPALFPKPDPTLFDYGV